jgi:hypothetical protein
MAVIVHQFHELSYLLPNPHTSKPISLDFIYLFV